LGIFTSYPVDYSKLPCKLPFDFEFKKIELKENQTNGKYKKEKRISRNDNL